MSPLAFISHLTSRVRAVRRGPAFAHGVEVTEWLLASPWALGYGAIPAAAAADETLGVALVVVSGRLR
jgi:hypothetical protein